MLGRQQSEIHASSLPKRDCKDGLRQEKRTNIASAAVGALNYRIPSGDSGANDMEDMSTGSRRWNADLRVRYRKSSHDPLESTCSTSISLAESATVLKGVFQPTFFKEMSLDLCVQPPRACVSFNSRCCLEAAANLTSPFPVEIALKEELV